MNKSTAGIALAAAVGLSALSAAPAMASHSPFQNCGEAEALGVFNIPASSPLYGTHLDSDLDGIGCENANAVFNPNLVPVHDTNNQVPNNQVRQTPVGGAATGVAQDAPDNTGLLALTGGLVLAAAAGGTFVVRRRARA
jgi:Excalibur calcium-binding domain